MGGYRATELSSFMCLGIGFRFPDSSLFSELVRDMSMEVQL